MVLVPVLSAVSLPASETASAVVSDVVSVSEARALPPKTLAVSTDTVSTPAKNFWIFQIVIFVSFILCMVCSFLYGQVKEDQFPSLTVLSMIFKISSPR